MFMYDAAFAFRFGCNLHLIPWDSWLLHFIAHCVKESVQIGNVPGPHICRLGLLMVTKHEETPSSHDYYPTATTFSLSNLPFLIEFSCICNHITQKQQPQETVSVWTVTARWHNSKKTGRKVTSVFDESVCEQSAQTYSAAVCPGTREQWQTYSICVLSQSTVSQHPYTV